METEISNATDEMQIRQLINHGIEAIRVRDIDKLMPNYAPAIVSFDVVGQLQYVGLAAITKRMTDWFSSFDGPIGFEISDLSVNVAVDMAFCHRLNHVSATKKDGGQLDMRWRETACYRKLDGEWLITHQHSSVPFDPESGQASLGLKP
jgi:uncharacterized protein (TIGR02246 family)